MAYFAEFAESHGSLTAPRRQLSDSQQLQLVFVEKDVPVKGYEYAVLVTDLPYDTRAIAQLYRDRGDAENAFDELKNQWGWGGFTTKDLLRCQVAARNVALIDGVQDPGNLGAILRTAAAMGVDAVVLGKGTCDAYNPKVVRASAAALLRVPLETGEDLAAKMQFLRLKGFTVVATSPHAQQTLEQAKLRRKVALLFGNEGAGVGANLADQADVQVRIPMRGKVESLNVAVAHGLLTHELVRLQEKS